MVLLPFYEGMEILFSAIHAAMSSYPYMLITAAADAYLTYRWYRARFTASFGTRNNRNGDRLFTYGAGRIPAPSFFP